MAPRWPSLPAKNGVLVQAKRPFLENAPLGNVELALEPKVGLSWTKNGQDKAFKGLGTPIPSRIWPPGGGLP